MGTPRNWSYQQIDGNCSDSNCSGFAPANCSSNPSSRQGCNSRIMGPEAQCQIDDSCVRNDGRLTCRVLFSAEIAVMPGLDDNLNRHERVNEPRCQKLRGEQLMPPTPKNLVVYSVLRNALAPTKLFVPQNFLFLGCLLQNGRPVLIAIMLSSCQVVLGRSI